MTWFRSFLKALARTRQGAHALPAVVCALLLAVAARAQVAAWIESVVAGSPVEAALYRVMEVPGARVLYPRPPAEAVTSLSALVKAKPDATELYGLRARAEEQALDFSAAEADWKNVAAHARDEGAALVAVADFYHRRVRGADEVAALMQAANAPAPAGDQYVAADLQVAWSLFPRALNVAQAQALGDEAMLAIGRAWIARYPAEPATYAAYVLQAITLRHFDTAAQGIAEYRAKFPAEEAFPIKATAYAALAEGRADALARAAALFDRSFQPLWPDDVMESYFAVLDAAHLQHATLARAQAQLAAHPEDWMAAAKVFLAYQHQGRVSTAVATLEPYRAGVEARHGTWSADALYTFSRLLEGAGQSDQAARYFTALAGSPGTLTALREPPAQAGLAGVIRLLFQAPESGIALGAGNLAMLRDAGTIDQGPGYWNGILSLWLNSTDPAAELNAEETKAARYFHRAKAAELLAVYDERFPHAADRAALHQQMLQAYRDYGRDDLVEAEGKRFLAAFPDAPQRLEIAFEVADLEAQHHEEAQQLALYEGLLGEYAAKLHGAPAGLSLGAPAGRSPGPAEQDGEAAQVDEAMAAAPAAQAASAAAVAAQRELLGAFHPAVEQPAASWNAAAYNTVLDRYVGVLVAARQAPAALALLRRELDRHPDDAGMYERLAQFLEQNDLGAQQEEVYKEAIARFNQRGFYDRLARLYLKARRRQDYDALSRKVVDVFAGTELDQYFRQVRGPWPDEALALNLYAHQRFPHDLTFTRNLLRAYRAKGTANSVAWHALLKEHWQDAPDLEQEYFHDLAATGKLDAERAALEAMLPDPERAKNDPAAARELACLDVWQSHFERAAPLAESLALAYPADTAVGDQAASVLRSLAYLDAGYVERAAVVAQHLAAADAGNLDRLATVGDIYANSTSSALQLDNQAQMERAAPYWRRMAQVHPGRAQGYVDSATVFWDYFDFSDALEQVQQGRDKLKEPALYAFEAGVIAEDQRDAQRAVAEYVRAAVAPALPAAEEDEHAEAGERLKTLARRPAYRALVDQATAAAVAQQPTEAALALRAEILTAQGRAGELQATLLIAVAQAHGRGDLAELEEFSRQHGLARAYMEALTRESALVDDPVEKIQVEYKLAAALSDAGQTAQADALIAAIYQGQPKLVGVVRQTTDYYWTHKQPQRAIGTLEDAARNANARYAMAFTLEAVAKSNESGDAQGARALLKPLRAAAPFDPRLIALEADSYAAAHDAAGLRDFYAATLTSVQAAPPATLPSEQRRDRVALLRRGMIVALTELKDDRGATDQHIALISAFPADDGVVDAAASYARLHGTEAQLKDFLTQAVTSSPKDARFAIDLARVDVAFEDPQGALAAYSRAIGIRGDRADLYRARADLEERGGALDAACADYERLYTLTYKDAQWMEDVAQARARQGRAEDAAKALQTAWMEGRPVDASDAFRVAERLTEWGLLQQAQQFADQGLQEAGDHLLREPHLSGDAEIYARLAARQRRVPEALRELDRLRGLGGGSALAPAVVVRQVQEKGLGAVMDGAWRRHLVERRAAQAERAYRQAVMALSTVVGELYTPEEKLAVARALDQERKDKPADEVAELWIPAAHAAALTDREAAWRRDVLLGGPMDLAAQQTAAYDSLEARRMDDRVRAQTFDAYALRFSGDEQNQPLALAAAAWHDAGDRTQEVRDLRTLVFTHAQTQYEGRLLEALAHTAPAELEQLAASRTAEARPAADLLGRRGTEAQVYTLLAARAPIETPLWLGTYRALFGLYFADTSAATQHAFEQVLGAETVGDALKMRPVVNRQFVGMPWFAYATRYGVWSTLGAPSAPASEDDLPAVLEAAPGTASSYQALGAAYAEVNKPDAAIAEYRHAEELAPEDAAPNMAIAQVLWQQGKADAAVAEWNAALGKLTEQVHGGLAMHEEFWTQTAEIGQDAAAHRVGTRLRPAMTALIAAYLGVNGSYRSLELEHAAYTALAPEGESAAAAWVVELAQTAAEDVRPQVLAELGMSGWYPDGQLDQVFRARLVLAEARSRVAQPTPPQPAAADEDGHGDAGEDVVRDAAGELAVLRAQSIDWLLEHGRLDQAAALYAQASPAERSGAELQYRRLEIAAKQGRLAALLGGLGEGDAPGPSLDVCANVAGRLGQSGDYADQRLLLEYMFAAKFRRGALGVTDYFALAEARLKTGDTAGALDLLRRVTYTGDFYQNLDTAAGLLERTGHAREAEPMLRRLVESVPWQAGYRLRLGAVQKASGQGGVGVQSLAAVAADGQAAYQQRVAAARVLARQAVAHGSLGSAELTLLAAGSAMAEQAGQPYFVAARELAAAKTQSPQERVALLRAALLARPDDEDGTLALRVFEAEAAAGNDRQAEVAVQLLLARMLALRGRPPEADVRGYLAISAQAQAEDRYSGAVQQGSIPVDGVPAELAARPAHAAFLGRLAMLEERLDEMQAAAQDFSYAALWTQDAGERAQFAARARGLQERERRKAEDQARRPILRVSEPAGAAGKGVALEPGLTNAARVRPQLSRTAAPVEVRP